MKTMRTFKVVTATVAFCMASHLTTASAAKAADEFAGRYTGMLNQLRVELTAKAPKIDLEKAKTPGSPEEQQLKAFLASDALDAKLAKYVVLLDGTPEGLAEFARQGKVQAAQVVTVNYDQRLNVSVNDSGSGAVIQMLFTCGDWKECEPVTLAMKEGENVLRFSRTDPPQYGDGHQVVQVEAGAVEWHDRNRRHWTH